MIFESINWSLNKSVLFEDKIIEVFVSHLELQVESNLMLLAFDSIETKQDKKTVSYVFLGGW